MHKCGIHCIVSPHMVDSILQKGDKDQVKMAKLLSEKSDKKFRDEREFAPHSLAMFTSQGLRRTVHTCKNKTRLPGSIIRKEEGPKSGDQDAEDVFEN